MFELVINGQSVKGDADLDVINPATGKVFATCSRASANQVNDAVAAAKTAFEQWSKAPLAIRGEKLAAVADLLVQNADELSRLLTKEQGKPLAEAKGEIEWAASVFRNMQNYDLPVEVLEDTAQRRAEAHRIPLGVVVAINPWNFPLVTPAGKIAPALYAGNTLVLKPAPTTPLTMLRFAELAQQVLPPGVFNVIVDNNDLGELLTSHPDVRKITFTGSTATGKKVMASAASGIKRVALELGGNDPAIVLDDVNVQEAAKGIFAGAFGNCGQVCVAIKRVYVPESIYDDLCIALVELAQSAVVGDGLDPETTLGPIQNKLQFDKLKGFLDDARQDGKIIAGGEVLEMEGYFIAPTIVRDISDGSRLVDEEQFGPILPVVKYKKVEDAIVSANSSPYGLGSSVWSGNRDRALEVAKKIQTGCTWINRHPDSTIDLPFGGAKQSGFGVEYGKLGLEEFTQLHVITM
jgi:acyl-CoA reductase-like NAD-dependent aldehyde dehydrogenase